MSGHMSVVIGIMIIKIVANQGPRRHASDQSVLSRKLFTGSWVSDHLLMTRLG